MTRPAVGVTFRPQLAPEDLPPFAAGVERLGFDELWVVEDCFFAGGVSLATAALGATSSLHVGIGLLPAAVRNPAVAAMEIAAVSRMHPGRLTVAFGHGVDAWMRQIGARPRDRLEVLEETLRVVSRLLKGRSVSVAGGEGEVELDHPPPVPPRLLVGTTGRRGLDVAARLSDGVLLPQGASADAVRWARGVTTAVDPASATVVYAWLSLGDDASAARAVLRPALERWRDIGRYPELARRLPVGPGGIAPLSDAALDATLDAMAMAGDPAACAAAVTRWADAGADSVVLRPPVEGGWAQVARFARDVLPLLGPR